LELWGCGVEEEVADGWDVENELEDDVEVIVLLDVVETDVTWDVGCAG
jgi:hypothetical protein